MPIVNIHRVVTATILFSFLVSTMQTVRAQTVALNSVELSNELTEQSEPVAQQVTGQANTENPKGNETVPAGMVEGEILAESIPTGGKLALGLGLGILTGLIGTGIGYFVIGPEPMTASALQQISDKNSAYQLGFKSGWEKKTQSKKRNSFLTGGLLGTAAFVAILVSIQRQEEEY